MDPGDRQAVVAGLPQVQGIAVRPIAKAKAADSVSSNASVKANFGIVLAGPGYARLSL